MSCPQVNSLQMGFAKYMQKEYSEYHRLSVDGNEGIDARIKKVFSMVDVTVGPFVTTGGELPAMIMIDVIARQIPGVLGSLIAGKKQSVMRYTRL